MILRSIPEKKLLKGCWVNQKVKAKSGMNYMLPNHHHCWLISEVRDKLENLAFKLCNLKDIWTIIFKIELYCKKPRGFYKSE